MIIMLLRHVGRRVLHDFSRETEERLGTSAIVAIRQTFRSKALLLIIFIFSISSFIYEFRRAHLFVSFRWIIHFLQKFCLPAKAPAAEARNSQKLTAFNMNFSRKFLTESKRAGCRDEAFVWKGKEKGVKVSIMETEVSEQKCKHVKVQHERVQKFDKLRQLHKLFRSNFISNSLFEENWFIPSGPSPSLLSYNNYKNDFSFLLSPINQSESWVRKSPWDCHDCRFLFSSFAS